MDSIQKLHICIKQSINEPNIIHWRPYDLSFALIMQWIQQIRKYLGDLCPRVNNATPRWAANLLKVHLYFRLLIAVAVAGSFIKIPAGTSIRLSTDDNTNAFHCCIESIHRRFSSTNFAYLHVTRLCFETSGNYHFDWDVRNGGKKKTEERGRRWWRHEGRPTLSALVRELLAKILDFVSGKLVFRSRVRIFSPR